MSIAQTSPLAQYALYEDPDSHTVLFKSILRRRYNSFTVVHKYYRYNTRTCKMYRVYAKNKKKPIDNWWGRNGESEVSRYIQGYALLPVWPPHMKVDIGL